MHAMAGTARRRDEPHRLRPALAEPLVQRRRSSARPASTRRSAAPGAARCCSSPATRRPAARRATLLGDGLTTVAVKQGLGRFSARSIAAAAGARADRGRARSRRSPTSTAVRAVRPGQPVRDPGRVQDTTGVGRSTATAGRRARRRPRTIVSRGRRLVDGLAAVLLLVAERAHELAEPISSSEAVPGSGWVAGVSGAFAAALVAKSASRSEGWSGAEGARAQALELRDRLLALAAQDAPAPTSRRWPRSSGATPASPRALAKAAEVPLAIAGAAATSPSSQPGRPSWRTGTRRPTPPPRPRSRPAPRSRREARRGQPRRAGGRRARGPADRSAEAAADAARRALATD